MTPPRATLESDCCIIGGGPAGLTLALALGEAGQAVVLLESGGRRFDPWSQELNQGSSSGDLYAGLAATRHRQLGGAAHLWNTPVPGGLGAKYVPLDPGDFEGAWPFGYEVLVPWYRRAQQRCGLGPFEYDAAFWADALHPVFSLGAGPLRSAVYQFGAGQLFTSAYVEALESGRKTQLRPGATAVELRTDPARERVLEVVARGRGGSELVVRARHVVLAGGAVENARLLLVAGLGTGSEWLGRGFMEHPRDSGLTLFARDPEFTAHAGFYDLHLAGEGTSICGRLALRREVLRAENLPNASVTLLPLWENGGARWGARLARWLGRRPRQGHGWSRPPHRPGAPPAFRLLMNLEQRPHPDNRIALSADRDALGVPRASLAWRWRPEEQRDLERLRALIAGAIETAGLGRVSIETGQPPDPNAHHHAGTTRMHADPGLGVVDPDCRVHGLANLFIAGAAVFPTAGFANPTLTVVALALRLADRLARGD